jgi:hypothetical protein
MFVLGALKVPTISAGTALVVAASGLTLANWGQILTALGSLAATIFGAIVLLVRLRRPVSLMKPIPPPAGSPARVWEAYYRANDEYNRAQGDQQP